MTNKLLPLMTSDSAPFWEGCARHELLHQYCTRCGKAQFPPARHCRTCFAPDPEWRRSAGLGWVHSLTHVHRAPSPEFQAEVPYTLALIDLAEGFRMMTCLRGEGRENAEIGDGIEIIFEALSDEVSLPQSRLRAHDAK